MNDKVMFILIGLVVVLVVVVLLAGLHDIKYLIQ